MKKSAGRKERRATAHSNRVQAGKLKMFWNNIAMGMTKAGRLLSR